MVKILILTPSRTDSPSFYRSGGIAPDLKKRMDIEIDIRQPDQIILHWQNLLLYDLIMLQRPYLDDMVSLMDYCKDLGIPLWVDYDDYLLGVPADNHHSATYDPHTRENIKALLKGADIVSVSTKPLKEAFKEYNKDIRVIPNAFNDFIFKKTVFQPQRQRLFMWRGGESHIYDIMSMGNAYNKAMKAYKDWHFLFMGFMPWYLDRSSNFFHLDPQDVIHYHKNVLKMAPAAFTVPLYDNLFNHCKSNIAWIEASYFGAVCIAPDWEDWQVPGVLKYSNEAEFSAAISTIAEGYDYSKDLKAAADYIRGNLMLSEVNKLREDIIKSLL